METIANSPELLQDQRHRAANQAAWPTADTDDVLSLVRGFEETSSQLRDDFGNWEARFSPRQLTNQLRVPVVEAALARPHPHQPIWPNSQSFAVCLSHDVDHVAHYSARQRLRRGQHMWRSGMRSAGYFAKLGATALAKGLLGLARGGVRDPYSRFERWLELEEKFGFRSTFFFPSDIDGRRHPEDPEYSFDDKIYFQGRRVAVGEMMRWMHKHGWEVGIHGTWYTREDAEFLAAQRRRVESVIGAPVVSNRQHYLRYDPIKTPHVLQQAGLKIDSTLGFNRDIGFRRGTCWPHRLYDPANQRATDVVSVPLVAQDSALFVSDSLHLDKHGATASVIALLEHVQHYRGCVAIGWHPNTFEDTLYQGWFAAYEAILQWIKQHNGWGCSLVQAVQVWRESRP